MSAWRRSLPGATRVSHLASPAASTLHKQQSLLNRTCACACSAQPLRPRRAVDSSAHETGSDAAKSVAEHRCVAAHPLPHRRRADHFGVGNLIRVVETASAETDRAKPQLPAAFCELRE